MCTDDKDGAVSAKAEENCTEADPSPTGSAAASGRAVMSGANAGDGVAVGAAVGADVAAKDAATAPGGPEAKAGVCWGARVVAKELASEK